MLNKLPQTQDTLVLKSVNSTEIINTINFYIENNPCKNMDIDISFMNIIDSCRITTLCSTKHFAKYPDGKINWKISSKLIEELNKDFELGNNSYIL
ncbi:hypothetical protein J6R97_04450 [bacterium]|jgi:hypothetical protein|nr:hypothetical protein [bacterium]